jgi:hypothetical protein
MNIAGELLAKESTEKATARYETKTLFIQNRLKKIMDSPPFARVDNVFFLPETSPFVNFKCGQKRKRSLPGKGEKQCQDNADDDTGSEGNREGKGIPLPYFSFPQYLSFSL